LRFAIADVPFEKTIYQAPPLRFEVGTGNIADAVGLGAAIDYLDRIGMANIASYEHGLLDTATQGLLDVPGLTIIGTAKEKAGVSPSCSMAAAARMSAPSSTEKAPRSALATIACSRSCAGSR